MQSKTKQEKQNSTEKVSTKVSIKVSIVITTYNWPMALRAVLNALTVQTCHDFEILIADDGSSVETAQLIQQFKTRLPVPIQHIWQEDQGFRAAMIRNKAIAAATGDYIIFLDGDCIPCPNFVAAHIRESEAGYFVVGNRILLTREFTVKILSEDIPLHTWSPITWIKTRLLGHCNKVLPLLLTRTIGAKILSSFRKMRPTRWQGAKTCNLAVWRSDLMRVNGFEEKFVGWGYEDSDLVIRLINANVKRKGGRFAVPVIHLWHPENDRSQESKNWELLQERRRSPHFLSEKGLNQYYG